MILTLICKYLLHNSLGALDSKTLARISSVIQKMPNNPHNTPVLGFVQRDFCLQIADKEGNSL